MSDLTLVFGSLPPEPLWVPVIDFQLPCGFPSPADDYQVELMDLNRIFFRNPDSSFLARATGESMTGAFIHDGDLLGIDRSVTPRDGDVVVAWVDGAYTVKTLSKRPNGVRLLPANPAYEPVDIKCPEEMRVWGVVVLVLHTLVHESRLGLSYVRPS
ncbi:LexA family protein [Hymenobacter psychrotolerans]|uniref:DNA polymerase V n=1 Tax=Hymenobacter psychrotolerans DSM 18569 TaxID=1121959 RepID=A0A1M6UQ62_9BACT|nr:translesion error-prone DNA polymerase V autoproteolytic subunit [Hymenobacter psychrotolerans]SHK71299.1 DNA polymerase V [Hymenobacter psychrotolerans DSM 18569]